MGGVRQNTANHGLREDTRERDRWKTQFWVKENHATVDNPWTNHHHHYYYYYYYIEFLTFQLQLGNIHLSLDLVLDRIRLGGIIYSLESFLQLNMCQELQIFIFVCMYLDAS